MPNGDDWIDEDVTLGRIGPEVEKALRLGFHGHKVDLDDKRGRNDAEQDAKRRRVEKGESELPVYATKYSQEEIEGDIRKPKRKVAVMIGYNGGGYRGMQLDKKQKTIEGDLFRAFVQAGAISKANAEDPKKSSFVRCARTDKGVHAAGNVISLKLIIEDSDIVSKINENLPSQIRVWGLERTNNSFSCYQLCDSRIYEYLIPTHSFLPPHPRSFLGQQTAKIAEEKNDLEGWKSRQEEVENFWETVDERDIKPLLAELDERQRRLVEMALFPSDAELEQFRRAEAKAQKENNPIHGDEMSQPESNTRSTETTDSGADNARAGDILADAEEVAAKEAALTSDTHPSSAESVQDLPTGSLQSAIKALRATYISARRNYRIDEKRLERIHKAFKLYHGTKNFHNYTIEKHHSDPSAKRIIKSFSVNPQPILINNTEWLSLKVHGQSFMMHQIRKMVSMVAMIVRCGCDPHRILQTYGPDRYPIPKAPSLGLLLERPVFESYNNRCKDLGRDPVTFDHFEQEMQKFKQEQIYDRIYHDEEANNVFGNFFNHVDNWQKKAFLFVTSGGLEATQGEMSGGDLDKELVQGPEGLGADSADSPSQEQQDES
ncbi:MAG: hypothetical protein Q9160_003002 [Pyrenula sp. 1 TL-2023]